MFSVLGQVDQTTLGAIIEVDGCVYEGTEDPKLVGYLYCYLIAIHVTILAGLMTLKLLEKLI